MSESLTTVILLFEGVTPLDATGPAQVLAAMPGGRVATAAKTREPIATDAGFALVPTHDLDDAPAADILLVPGGPGVADAVEDEALIAFVRRQATVARRTVGVCTGSLILGAAGLLRGKRATTHWAYTQLLRQVGAEFAPGRVVSDGSLVTGGGVTAGIDVALALLHDLAGERTAAAVRLALEYDPPSAPGGHPDSAYPKTVEGLRRAVYEEPAARIAAALERIGDP